METAQKITIGELVARDYRAATVFESFGIDFCCKGNRTIEEACETKKVNVSEVKIALDNLLDNATDDRHDFNFWPLDILADYIEKKHHRYVEERIPLLLQYLNKLCKVHGESHPELFEITRLFSTSASELSAHMKKEELILFPYLRKMVKKPIRSSGVKASNFRSVKLPIHMMMEEHETEGDRFKKIAELTNNYNPPADACNTYKVTYSLLEEFEGDLHKHIHLENNVLFPRSIAHEAKIQQLELK
ncbi:iron-sulfur cluster repair di-iron protein [Cyclobacterium plantarum]|uniref:Iron-sulfur cluster repair di-iron protein n=1 Tax=Cyclobacterium plantarum TaxID=2716263 RepID=A0ABX0H3V0_9BACT|nr:iron-sulfur cluster repair di-iron protein [Cyclobacterium plantarum]NHE56496.1 iron-sulfur cluster repair di-iron protein [Cyclobacterium plantarum]